jgi:hypothetical protein
MAQKGGTKVLGRDDKAIASLLTNVAEDNQSPQTSPDTTEAALMALAKMGPLAIDMLPRLYDLIDNGNVTAPSQAQLAAQTVYAIAKIARTGPQGKDALPIVRRTQKIVVGWYMSGTAGIGPHAAALCTQALEIVEGKRDPESD